MNYIESGNKQGIPVVFIHAFPLNQAMWNEQTNYLQKTARTITFDIRGLGQNEDKAPYTIEFIVDDLFEILDLLKIKQAVVCGLSMGGYVALRAIQRNPERFLGLILADTKSESDSDKAKLSRYEAIKRIKEKGLSSYTDSFLKTSITNPTALEIARKLTELNTPNGVASAVLALMSRTDTTSALKDIQTPTLIIQGELDAVIPMEAANALHEQIKGSSLFVVPKAGHLSNLENPEAFNSELLKFLNSLEHRQ